jgi:ATP-dependent Lon protease
MKLIYPHGKFDKEAVSTRLTYALEVRRQIKEQLKKLGGMDVFDVHFSYIDNETLEEFYVNVKEQRGSRLIPEGASRPGVVHLVTQGSTD